MCSDKPSMWFSEVIARTCVWGGGERERLPSFTASHQGVKKQTSWTEEERDEGGKKERHKRGEEKQGEREMETVAAGGNVRKRRSETSQKRSRKQSMRRVGREGGKFKTWVISSKSFSNVGQKAQNSWYSWYSQDPAAWIKPKVTCQKEIKQENHSFTAF